MSAPPALPLSSVPLPSSPQPAAPMMELSLNSCESMSQLEESLLAEDVNNLSGDDSIWSIERLDINVDISDDPSPEKLNEQVATLFNQLFVPDLSVKASQVSINRLNGGMTNLVYEVTVDPAPSLPTDKVLRILRVPTDKQQQEVTQMPRKYLLRIYGACAGDFVSRDKELYWLRRLALLRIGPQIYGLFGNGRVEEFLESKTLTVGDMCNASTSKQIAQRMCELHTLVSRHSPLSVEDGKQNNEAAAAYLSGEPELWSRIDSWMELIKKKWPEIRRKCDGNMQCAGILDNWHQVEQALHKFKTYIKKDVHSPIVFAHNDLLYSNFLQLEGSDEIVLIDYEFSGYNYRGFDIANHFFTWMYNFSSLENPHLLQLAWYPTVEQRYNFLRAYIQAKAIIEANASVIRPNSAQMAEVCTTYLTEDQIRKEVAALDYEVTSFAKVLFLLWGLFGLLKTSAGNTDLDFVSYSAQRLSLFLSQMADMG
ncbi:hypothetical protein GGI22_000895 [Coemansia erecta]|nr:hypothetical protein GGI22_000895 [Coemansia erecta]